MLTLNIINTQIKNLIVILKKFRSIRHTYLVDLTIKTIDNRYTEHTLESSFNYNSTTRHFTYG